MTGLRDVDVPDGVLWWTFTDQTWVGHAVVVVIGAIVWCGTYWFWLDAVAGGAHLLFAEGAAATAARQDAMRAAGTACWLWFSLAFISGKGGPFLNTVIYPTILLVLGPYLTGFATFGRFARGDFSAERAVSVTFYADVVWIVLHGVAVVVLVIGGFLLVSTFVTGAVNEWADRHLPEEWHEVVAQVETERADSTRQ